MHIIIRLIIVTLLISSLNIISCVNSDTKPTELQTKNNIITEHEHDEENQGIELNNGEKWIVDKNMNTHIRIMEKDLLNFAKLPNKDYKVLSVKLQQQIDLLTSNCTMKGKAHDELHKWLLPYMDLVTELTEAENNVEAENIYQKIQLSFTTFNQYFI